MSIAVANGSVATVLMPTPASSCKRKKRARSRGARGARAWTIFAVAIIILPSSISSTEEETPIASLVEPNANSDVAVLTLGESEYSLAADAAIPTPDVADSKLNAYETCLADSILALSHIELPPPTMNLIPLLTTPQSGQEMLGRIDDILASVDAGGADLISYAQQKPASDLGTTYRDLLGQVAIANLQRIQHEAALARATVIGTVSTYNPFRPGKEEGGPQTASGEPYDPTAWTAAIKTELRNQFRGVRYGRLYQPTFALVDSGDKQLIVKINDVGPLRPGRVLDLNERSMRHFDPSMTRGLIEGVKITLLPGEDWTPGPVGSAYAIALPVWRTASIQTESIESTMRLTELGSVQPGAPVDRASYSRMAAR